MTFTFRGPLDAYAQWKKRRQESRDARTLSAACDIIVKRVESARSDVRWWGERIREDIAGLRRDFEGMVSRPVPHQGPLQPKKKPARLTKKRRKRNH